MTCKYCNFEMCFMCEQPREDEINAAGDYRCCCDGLGYRPGTLSLADTFMANRTDVEEDDEVGPRLKDGSAMKDVLSTGRKRAAKAAPITEGMVCEWAGLLYAGGGVVPIVGCAGNIASDRHHGCDKNVLNNVVKVNLHRICDIDHARWHTLNDPYYGERPPDGEAFLPLPGFKCMMHDSHTQATPEETIANETWWRTPIGERPGYREWTLSTTLSSLQLPKNESENTDGQSKLMVAGTSTSEPIVLAGETLKVDTMSSGIRTDTTLFTD